jgi:uncharacterized protein (TIGR03382 family)
MGQLGKEQTVCFASPMVENLRWHALALVIFMVPNAAAFDGTHVVIPGGQWDVSGGPIPIVIDPDGSDDIPGDSENEAILYAFRSWACQAGTPLKFELLDEPGPKSLDSPGKNTFFWDEDGSICGMGPGTLGITVGDAGGTSRNEADICFNGLDHQWKTDEAGTGTTDTVSIAIHEIGHFIGLDHPCDPGETNCNGPERSVMTPTWSGNNERDIYADDLAGLYALYPDDGSGRSCEGPFGQGERCACNGECTNDLLCVDGGDGVPRCSKTCSASVQLVDGQPVGEGPNCGAGAACVLTPKTEGDASGFTGVCIKITASELPPGAVCRTTNDCVGGLTCEADFDIGASVCQKDCADNTDCGASGLCQDGTCLGSFAGIECPVEPVPGPCGCQGSKPSSPMWAWVMIVAAVGVARRRNTHA